MVSFFRGLVVSPDERESISKDLGPNNKVIVLNKTDRTAFNRRTGVVIR